MSSQTPPEPSPPALEVLDPSPVEEDAPFSEEGYFPPPARSQTLGLRTHRPAYYLHRIQKYTSYTFTIFAAFHITNTGLIPLFTRSVDESNKYLLLTRPYYQSWPLAEPLIVILPLAAHILSGVSLRLYRRHVAYKHAGAETRTEKREYRKRQSLRISSQAVLGYLAIPLVIGHAAITRGLPVRFEGDSSGIGIDFVSHGIAIAPIVGCVGFTALVGITSAHIIGGWAYWTGWTPQQLGAGEAGAKLQLRRKRRQWVIGSISLAVAGAWLAGGLGVIGRAGKVQRPAFVARLYEELYRHVPYLDRLA